MSGMKEMFFPSGASPGIPPIKPGRIGLMAIYLTFAAVLARTLTSGEIGCLLPRYLGLELVFLGSFSYMFTRPNLPAGLLHCYFVFQSAIVLLILALNPEFDFVVLLFMMLSYQASLFFTGRMRWAWIGGLTFLIGGSLIYYLGFIRGLSLALTTMAATIVLPAYLLVNQETEIARAESQTMLNELDAMHRKLQEYAGQVEELAVMQERDRLSQELHDRVSQLLLSISLAARSAQMLIGTDQKGLLEQLNQLQEMTADALSQLRSFITQLRPAQKS